MGLYQRVLADTDLADRLVELTSRFEALAGLDVDDPAVDALVADATRAGDAVLALMPDELRRAPGDPQHADLLLGAVTADMGSAQVRRLTLLFDAWRDASS